MAISKALPLFLALTALYGSSLAGGSGHAGKRRALADRTIGMCHEQGWIPACPGTFACVPPGAVCCPDEMSYAMPGEACPEGAHPLPTAAAGPGPDRAHSHESHAPDVTAPPHRGSGSDAPGVDFLGFGSNWYTFAMTYHFLSHWYSNIDHTSSVLISSEVTSCTTVSVSATDKAHASQLFSSYTATAVLPIATETHVDVETHAETLSHGQAETHTEATTHVHSSAHAVESAAPVYSGHGEESATYPSSGHVVEDAHVSSVHSVDSASSVAPAGKPSPTKAWKADEHHNHTVDTATKVPGPVATAGAANVGVFGIAVVALALGMAAALM